MGFRLELNSFVQTFKKDIRVLGPGEVGSLVAVANLDTSCDVGDWISHRLVRALGRQNDRTFAIPYNTTTFRCQR